MADGGEATGFLYPFLEDRDAGPGDADALLASLARSAAAKTTESLELAATTIDEHAEALGAAAAAMAERFRAGGRLLCCGNGGSSTDAAAAATLFAAPATGSPLPARSLADDSAVLTAIANDVGFDLVFARQVIAHGRPGDILLAISTSGSSANLVRGLEEARRRGLLTIGLAGHDGGHLARSDAVDHLVVVRSDSVHRIQETQAVVVHRLWTETHDALARPAPVATTPGSPS